MDNILEFSFACDKIVVVLNYVLKQILMDLLYIKFFY